MGSSPSRSAACDMSACRSTLYWKRLAIPALHAPAHDLNVCKSGLFQKPCGIGRSAVGAANENDGYVPGKGEGVISIHDGATEFMQGYIHGPPDMSKLAQELTSGAHVQ